MNLKEWCDINGAQELLQCYLNGNNPLPPERIGFSSGKTVNFKCGVCGIEWQNNLNHMSRKRKFCPYCNHERVSSFYNAALFYPELKDYWDSSNKGSLEDYMPKSGYNAVWRCNRNHRWVRAVDEQVRSLEKCRRSGTVTSEDICPYCNKQRVSSSYNLELVYPDVARQWNCIMNGELTPRDVAPCSNKKVYWVCEFDPEHIWKDRIANRTLLFRGCPICSRRFHISYAARAVYFYMRKNGLDCICEKKAGRYSIDIEVRTEKSGSLAVEIDGYYTHSRADSYARDAKKDEYLRNNGYQVIRVREDPEQKDGVIYSDGTVVYPLAEQNKYLDQMIKFLLELIAGITVEPDHKKDHWQIERLYYHDRKNRSIAVKYPRLAKEWSKKNSETPDVVFPGANDKKWWECPVCGSEYQASVKNRTQIGSACPYCARLKVKPDTCLAVTHREIACQWIREKNLPLTPENVLAGTDKKVWWRCDKGHEWEAYIYSRTGKQASGCPICSGHTVIPETSLAAHNPELAKFWHPFKNSKTAEETAPYSNLKVWWICPRGHEWRAIPSNMQKRQVDKFCPYCNNKRTWKGHCLAESNPELAKLWHSSKNLCTSAEIAPFSNKKSWWRCENGHEWQATPNSLQKHSDGKFCPYCNNRKVWSGYSLLNSAPELAKEWHPTKNGKLTVDKVFPCSSLKVWWRCEKGHEWEAPVEKRYLRKDGCPYCSGRRVSAENCLSTVHSDIAADWYYERNPNLTPDEVSSGSAKKVWWKCKNGHVRFSPVISRVKSGGCPDCRHGRTKTNIR